MSNPKPATCPVSILPNWPMRRPPVGDIVTEKIIGERWGNVMSNTKNARIQKRLKRYVSRFSMERRLEQYTTDYERWAKRAVIKANLTQAVESR